MLASLMSRELSPLVQRSARGHSPFRSRFLQNRRPLLTCARPLCAAHTWRRIGLILSGSACGFPRGSFVRSTYQPRSSRRTDIGSSCCFRPGLRGQARPNGLTTFLERRRYRQAGGHGFPNSSSLRILRPAILGKSLWERARRRSESVADGLDFTPKMPLHKRFGVDGTINDTSGSWRD